MTEHTIELAGDPGQARAALVEAVEGWGADLETEGGVDRLRLPVIAGLRRGFESGPIAILPDGTDGPHGKASRVVFRPDSAVYRLHVPAVVVLLVATFGSLLIVAWPFFPSLLGVAPFGALLALGGWFMVVSQLRSSGPQEFLEAIAAELAAAAEETDR